MWPAAMIMQRTTSSPVPNFSRFFSLLTLFSPLLCAPLPF